MNHNLLIVLITFVLIMAFIFSSNKTSSIETKTKYVSERLQACEDKGGKYSLIWSNLRNEYFESCQIISQDIEEF